ncbi:EAL domain-containing protein [Marinobacter lacisalsi]|uniref:EAL domain-containing protein n=1 Tax=Marinobacter lacisalsi TaxID=475979 RepID=A0ABV8QMH8_9GAMM
MERSRAEQRRLEALKRLGILDTPPDERFERLTRIAQRFYEVPVALFTLIDDHRQWFKSKQGLVIEETPRSIAFCDYAIREDKLFIVEDASHDVRFRNNPLVTGEHHIRFYAGMPVREPSGFKIGTLCILDRVPRRIPEFELDVLRSLASLVEDEIERAYQGAQSQEFFPVSQLTRAIYRAQNVFLTHEDESAAFELMLNDLLALTDSQFGFIGEVLHHPDNTPYLKIGAITNIAWSPETEGLYQQVKRRGMIFENSSNLIGASLATGQLVIANHFDSDPRRGGLPEGHPAIKAYQGIPIHSGDQLIGLVGLGNRVEGYSEELALALEPLLQTVGQLIERKRLYKERLDHKKSLEKAANYDSLTGLPNRRRLTELFEQELVEADRRQGRLSVCFIDLDGFKEINDQFGHSVGDMVLKTVAERLKTSMREHDLVARLGGDEFVAILRDVSDDGVYHRMLETIRQTIPHSHYHLQLSGSLGITVYPDDQAGPDLLLRHADQAMYAAKEQGRNQHRVFDVRSHVSRKKKLQVVEQISAALEQQQFELFLQPRINLRENKVEGFEALIRWNHPERGLVGPFEFLPYIEYTEYAADISRFVMADAIGKLQSWQAEGQNYSLSINLSPSHFLSERFSQDLKDALADCDKSLCSRLTLELLETTALDDASIVIKRLKTCRALGVDLSLDDFGTGYSSLDYFRRLPVQEIKIDRSFVTDMLNDPDDEKVVGAIIALSQNFHRRVVAEGIEDEATRDRLLEMGCYLAQGFYFTRPLPSAEALAWADAFHRGG